MTSKRIPALLLAVLLCLSLCGCGSHKSASPAEMPMPMTQNAMYDSAGYAAEEYGAAPMAAANGLSAKSARQAASDTGKTSGGETPEDNPEKIIYSGEATVETTGFDQTIEALEAMIAENGGFIESSSVNGSNYYDSSRGKTSKRTASYTLRVPSEKFAVLMGSLSAIGNVPYSYTYTENVTTQYYDTAARLTALEKQEERLLEMMELADTVEDIITIEDKLTDVRYRIDSLESSLRNWDRRVAYSSLRVTVKEVQVYTPETVTKLTYGQELVQAFTDALENAGQFFKDLLVFLVSSLPTIAILAVLFFVFRPLLRKLFARGRARRAARKAAKSAPAQDAAVAPAAPGEKK